MADHLLLWGIVVHLICDWLLQNEYLAVNKVSLRHPAAYVHSGIHLAGLLLVFPPLPAACLAVSHLLIDTRKPLEWWRETFNQTRDPANPASMHVAMWSDQVLHVACLAVAAGAVGR
jgi:hypothetical protein